MISLHNCFTLVKINFLDTFGDKYILLSFTIKTIVSIKLFISVPIGDSILSKVLVNGEYFDKFKR